MIINIGCASVDNHITRDDIFDYHPLKECNIYIISVNGSMISQVRESFIFTKLRENKTLAKISEFTVVAG